MWLVGDSSIHNLTQSRQIHKISKVALSTLCTASHNHTQDICRIVFNIDEGFSSYVCYLQVKTNPMLIWKAKGYNGFCDNILIALKTR